MCTPYTRIESFSKTVLNPLKTQWQGQTNLDRGTQHICLNAVNLLLIYPCSTVTWGPQEQILFLFSCVFLTMKNPQLRSFFDIQTNFLTLQRLLICGQGKLWATTPSFSNLESTVWVGAATKMRKATCNFLCIFWVPSAYFGLQTSSFLLHQPQKLSED